MLIIQISHLLRSRYFKSLTSSPQYQAISLLMWVRKCLFRNKRSFKRWDYRDLNLCSCDTKTQILLHYTTSENTIELTVFYVYWQMKWHGTSNTFYFHYLKNFFWKRKILIRTMTALPTSRSSTLFSAKHSLLCKYRHYAFLQEFILSLKEGNKTTICLRIFVGTEHFSFPLATISQSHWIWTVLI